LSRIKFISIKRIHWSRSNRHHEHVSVIDLHRPRLTIQIPTIAAPCPLLRRSNKSTPDRIVVDIVQLLDSFLLSPNIEVIEPRSPKMFWAVTINWVVTTK